MKILVQCSALACALSCSNALSAQTPVLQKVGVMPVEGVAGEFDHFAIDLVHQRLYLAAEDQKTVEVFDLAAQKHISSIALFSRPHGLVFFPGSSRLIVADGGDGTVKFIDTETPKISSQVKTALRASMFKKNCDERLHTLGHENGRARALASGLPTIETSGSRRRAVESHIGKTVKKLIQPAYRDPRMEPVEAEEEILTRNAGSLRQKEIVHDPSSDRTLRRH